MLTIRSHSPRLRPFLALGDALALVLAIWLAHLIRFEPDDFVRKWRVLTSDPGLMVWAILSCWLLGTAAELYEPDPTHRIWDVLARLLLVVGAWSGGMVLATYVRPSWSYGRGLMALTALIWLLAMLGVRRVFQSWLNQRLRQPALVVGRPRAVARFCEELARRPNAPWRAIDASETPLEEVRELAQANGARLIVFAGADSEEREELNEELSVLHFAGIPVVAAVDFWAWLDERIPLANLSPALFLHQPGFGAVPWNSFHRLTAFLDVILAAFFLILTAPVLIPSIIGIAIFDGFPVFYRQERLGHHGRRFKILKLRTMTRDAERNGPRFASENDPRVTVLGQVLRRLRIDEMPQLINILRGEMSLVGPRPERPEFAADLAAQLPFYTFRLAVRPGLTGWAQVNTGYARDIDGHRRKLEYDLYYIREPSLRLYVLAILRTASAALAGDRRPVAAASALFHNTPKQTLESADDTV